MSNLRPLTISLLGGLQRAGRFAIGARATLVTLIGGMNLDLTEAEMPRTGVRLTKVSLIGGVRVSAFGLIGGVAVRTAAGSSRARARPPG